MLRFVVVVSVVALCVYGYPSGAPAGVCGTGAPKHGGAAPQATNSSPYTLTASPNSVSAGGAITLTIGGRDTYRGFLVSARDVSSSQPVGGVFTPFDAQAKALDCNGAQGSAITHTSNSDKSNVKVQWTAPAGFRGQVYFTATVVRSFDMYWQGLSSNSITVQ